MSRAVFLSTCGDPFLPSLVMKLWKERWYDEITHFIIDLNNNTGVPNSVVGEFLRQASQDPKVHILYHPVGIGNGRPITEMTLISQDDSILLLEDDGFIFDSGIVDSCFKRIENGEMDAIGSERFSCGEQIGTASAKKYGLDYTGYGDHGPNYWPNFFFCKRNDLLKTDLNFGSIHFNKGQYCKELDYTFTEQESGDTFVWTCIQLRALGIRFSNIPQHKADPYEVEHKESGEMNWTKEQQPFKWIHGGSLSAGWGGYLSGITPPTGTDMEKREIETRVSFWKIAFDTTEGFDDFKPLYNQGINDLIQRAQLDERRINQKYKLYRDLMHI